MKPAQLDATQPWDRRPSETPRAYNAFTQFRDLGQRRTLRDLCTTTGLSSTSVRTWQHSHDWIDRARAYDAWLDREATLDQVQHVKDMRRRHAVLGQLAVQKAGEKIRAIDAMKLTVREAAVLLEMGVKIERLARGEASDVVDVGVRGPSGQDILALLRRNPDLVEPAEVLAAALRTSSTDVVHQHAALRRVDPEPEHVPAVTNGDGA
jgi:hypothetical protein